MIGMSFIASTAVGAMQKERRAFPFGGTVDGN